MVDKEYERLKLGYDDANSGRNNLLALLIPTSITSIIIENVKFSEALKTSSFIMSFILVYFIWRSFYFNHRMNVFLNDNRKDFKKTFWNFYFVIILNIIFTFGFPLLTLSLLLI